MTRVGECKQCGECCKWIGFHFEAGIPGAIEWLEARGWEFFEGRARKLDPCPHLGPDNICDLHGPDKPFVCRTYPAEPGQLIPGCGFSFEEVDDG